MLCDHGDLGLAYRETDPKEADEASIIDTTMGGECDKTVSVIAFDTEAGWSRDVSEDIARKLEGEAERLGKDLPLNTRLFVERHAGSPSIVPVGPWIEPAEMMRGALAMIREAVVAAGGMVAPLSETIPDQAEALATAIERIGRRAARAQTLNASAISRIKALAAPRGSPSDR